MSGLEFLAQIRSEGVAVSAILVSGHTTPISHAEAARLGALALFEKPIDIDALVAAIASIGDP